MTGPADEEAPQHALCDNARSLSPQGGRDGRRGKGEAGSSEAAYSHIAGDCHIRQRDDEPVPRGALEGVGLDPQIGFLHEVRSGRPGLALDLMEEFRAVLADRVALSLVNMRQVGPRDFKATESGAVEMKEEARKTILQTWQKKKQEMILHPFLDERVPIGLLPHLQALLLARHLRGDLDAYPPFLVK